MCIRDRSRTAAGGQGSSGSIHHTGKGADLVGINMEGPFISPNKGGAQNPEYLHKAEMCRRDRDDTAVDEKAVKAVGAAGVIRPDKTTCQVIIGTKVQFVYDELKKML